MSKFISQTPLLRIVSLKWQWTKESLRNRWCSCDITNYIVSNHVNV